MAVSIFQDKTEIFVGEADGAAIVTFRRTGDLNQRVVIDYDVTADTASAGVDFRGASGTVTMAAGADSAQVFFDILNDTRSEATESFAVSIVATDDPSISISVPRTMRVNILDDENPVQPPADPPLISDYDVTQQVIVSGLAQPINMEIAAAKPNVA